MEIHDSVMSHNLREVFKTLWDTVAVYYRLRILHYYDDKNNKNWITPDYLTLKSK